MPATGSTFLYWGDADTEAHSANTFNHEQNNHFRGPEQSRALQESWRTWWSGHTKEVWRSKRTPTKMIPCHVRLLKTKPSNFNFLHVWFRLLNSSFICIKHGYCHFTSHWRSLLDFHQDFQIWVGNRIESEQVTAALQLNSVFSIKVLK